MTAEPPLLPASREDVQIVPADQDEDEDDNQTDFDEAFARIEAILGDDELDQSQAADVFLAHLQANLQLPCEVTGIEDFQWEERYVIGGWSDRDYRQLKKTQPSFEDIYELRSIDRDSVSQWMTYGEDDIAAHVRRVSDGKLFTLGLCELKAVNVQSANYQLLDDFAIWFANSR